MTALNVIVLPDRVHLVSDGMANIDGKLALLAHKVTPLPHVSVAIGIRGKRGIANAVIDLASGCARSFDALRKNLPVALKAAFDAHHETWSTQMGPDFSVCEVVVAGWSETNGPTGFVIATSDLNAAYGLHAWVPFDITAAYFSPDTTGDLGQQFARTDFNEEHAANLIDRQRQMRPGDVGGMCQLTTVSTDKIETRILKRWS